jgi:hypothetical protein
MIFLDLLNGIFYSSGERVSPCFKPFWIGKLKVNSVALVRERAILAEQPPMVGEASANFADKGCHVVSMMDPYDCILDFLDWNRYFFFPVAPQLYSRS